MRGIAVLLVLAFHAWPGIIRGGFVGVDVFFVVSGYLITGILVRRIGGPVGLGAFYLRRIRRIFPALILTLIGVLALSQFLSPPAGQEELWRHAAAAAFFFPNFSELGSSGYFDVLRHTHALNHLWSLGVEEQFYLFWPAIIILLGRDRDRVRVAAWLLAVASLVYAARLGALDDASAYYLPQSRVWELLVGALLALEPEADLRRGTPAWRRALAWLSLAVLVASALIFDGGAAYPSFRALAPVLGSAGLIAFVRSASELEALVTWRPLVLTGLISYPLYLFHWPALSFIPKAWPAGGPSCLPVLASLSLSWILAWGAYRFVEGPARRGDGRVAAVLTLILALVGGLSWLQARSAPMAEARAQAESARSRTLKAYGLGHCLVFPPDPAAFAADCLESAPAGAPLAVLLGDSFAGCLRPGLEALQRSQRFRLAQWTVNGCGPLLGGTGDYRARCGRLNDWVHARILALHPEAVILAGNWDEMGLRGSQALQDKFRQTVLSLRARAASVIVFGQLPLYRVPQPDAAMLEWSVGTLYSRRFLRPESFETNALVGRLAMECGAVWVDPMRLLCVDGRCRDSVSRERYEPLAWDFGHLTEAGSVYLVGSSGLQLGRPRPAKGPVASH